MYDFHLKYIKKKYGDRAKLLFTDTGSLIYEIEAEDVYQDFWNGKTNLTIVITLKTPHTMIIQIRRSLVSLKTKHLVFPQLNSLVFSPKCIVTPEMIKKGEKC